MPINHHPVLRQVPRANGQKPTLFKASAASFRPYMRASTTPQTFDDWLYNDIPQLSIHVVNFEDASIITTTMLHTLTDMIGLMSFYRAWMAVLWGQDDQVDVVLGYKDRDPLENLQQGEKPPKYIFERKILKGWGFFKFVVRSILERWWYPHATLRFFTLPDDFVKKLSASARQELVATSKEEDPSSAFVSDGDILCAWWTRIILRNQNLSPNRTVCLSNNVNARDILAKMGLLPDTNTALLANAVYSAPCFTTASQVCSTTYALGLLASQVRDSIKQHRTVEQVKAIDAVYRESKAHTGHLPVFGDSAMVLCPWTNIYRGKLFQLDFSPAVKARGNQDEKLAKSVQPVFVSFTGLESRWSMRNSSAVVGRSDTGDWWMMCRLRDDIWTRVEKEFDNM